MKKSKIQKVDGEIHISLPEGVTAQDLADWLNDVADKKHLQFEELPERWTSLEYGEEWEDKL